MRKYRPKLTNASANKQKESLQNFFKQQNQLTLLNVYSCEKLDNIQIPDLKDKTNLIYSRIGEENNNSLTMVETSYNKIYFDEGTKNKFTGLVFIDRMDSKTVNLLESKDVIIYKNGKVIDFFEGDMGVSRLGQLPKFQAIDIEQNITQSYNNLNIPLTSYTKIFNTILHFAWQDNKV